ncbi:hypothetical protein AB0C18_42495 [Nonomuraea muscovyensis]|uniref:hypothetical protein n=1 Tax=Nonomuraea muscovyensis TaxID=1124761 RepID=UPI0033C38A6A
MNLDDLLGWLRSGRPVTSRTDFTVGTAMPDGRLDLCKQAIGPYGMRLVADALPAGGPARHLLLGTDGLGDDGAGTAAAGAVRAQAPTLYLGCNAITAAGACRIADRLTASPGIVRGLWLKRNPLGPAGGRTAARLAATLSGAPHRLTHLDLRHTGLTSRGALRLLAAARQALSPTRYVLGPGIASRAKRELNALAAPLPPLRPHPSVAAVRSVHRTAH